MIPDTMIDLMNESPLPPNGEWWAGASWQGTHDVWGEQDAREALGEVGKHLTSKRARRLTWRGGHPFLFDYAMRAGRDELVLLGLGLRKLGPRRIGPRLLAPEHYVRAKAEIRAGLILASVGEVVHEPDGAKAGGPDWRVSLGGHLGVRVEVKCPGRSEASRLRERAVAALIHGFMRGSGIRPASTPLRG